MPKRALISKKLLSISVVTGPQLTFLQTDTKGIIVSASEQLMAFTGYAMKDLIGHAFKNIISKKDQSKFTSFLKKENKHIKETVIFSLKGEKRNHSFQFSIEFVLGANNGNFLLNWNIKPGKSLNNNSRNGLLASADKLFNTNPQPVIIFDPLSLAIIYVNIAAAEFYEYTQNKLVPILLDDLIELHKKAKDQIKNTSFSSGIYSGIKKNDVRVSINLFISSILIGDKNFQIAFTSVDASPQNKFELDDEPLSESLVTLNKGFDFSGTKDLKKAYVDAREIIDNTPEIFFKLDTEGKFVFVSNEFEKKIGYTIKEIKGKHFTNIIHPGDIDIANQGFADIYQFGRSKDNIIFRAVKKSGGHDWFSTAGVFIFDKQGKPMHCLCFAQQITEIKQLVDKLEASEERYAAFIQHSSEAIWRFETAEPLPIDLPEEQLITDFISNGYLAECNDQMAKLYGFEEASDLVGAPLNHFISVHDPETRDYFKGFIQSDFNLVNVETHEADKDGNQKIFLNNLIGIVESKKLVRVWGTQRDVTEQRFAEKKSQEQLEQSKNFFQSLISNSLDGIVVLDAGACVTYAAASITNVLGYLPGEVIGKECFRFIHPEDIPIAMQRFNNEKNKLRKRSLEIRFRSKKGEWLWMLVRASNLYGQPSVKGMVVCFTNITQRKNTENILKESEKRFRHLADTVPVMIWVADENNHSTYFSKCWSDFTGTNLEKIIAEGWKKIIHPDDHQIAIEQYNLHFEKRLPFIVEYRVKSKEGYYKWVVDHGVPRFTPDGRFMGYIGSVLDIHYRKMAEHKLRYQARMIENIRDAIVSTDLDFNIITWNSMAEEIYGFRKEQVMGKPIRSIVHHEYIAVSREDVLIELYEKDNWEGEAFFDRNDGKRVYLLLSLSFVKNDKGERIGLVGIHRDITQRHETEMALRISEERYRSVVDALTEGIILQDREGKIITCNKSAEMILGPCHDLDDSPFKTPEWLRIKEDGSKFGVQEDPVTITLQTGKPLQAVIMGLQRPGNTFYWLSLNTEPIYYSAQRLRPDAVVTSFFDITQRKHQEQWLSLEKDVLEINARPSSSLKDTVDFYLKGIEKMFPDMICSILMLKEDRKRIQHLSAPSLPVAFSNAINGLLIGPNAGSCGTAMYLKQKIITVDINTDPLWVDYKALAAQHDLQSCWSFPIINAQNEVLATIAAYHKYPKIPSEKEVNIMDVTSNLLRIIIENKKTESNLRLSNERYLLATKATHDAIYDWDFIQNTVYRGESFYILFGYNRNHAGGLLDFLEEKLHPGDKRRVIKSLKDFIGNKRPDIWESEYRFLNASGKYVVVYDRGFLIFNQEGNITRLVGSMMDITERKELEKKLVKQEVDKQKQVAQAVVDAQEKERAEIGKELHDNVNQILSTARLYLELAKSDEKDRLSLIQRSYDNIYDAINEIRSISRSLVPPSIGDLGLIESIEDLVENIRATKKLYIEFCYSGNIDAILGQKQKLMLFRIIQEQVNNVLKHANARNIIIELMMDGHMIHLSVSDDGKGFDYEEVKNNKGVGLQNIASRTELFNGKINIVTAPNKGCKLNIHVPISKL